MQYLDFSEYSDTIFISFGLFQNTPEVFLNNAGLFINKARLFRNKPGLLIIPDTL